MYCMVLSNRYIFAMSNMINMKTTRTFSAAILGFVLSLCFFSEPGYTNNLIRTGATYYEGSWIPEVDLKEVTITGSTIEPGSGRFCEVAEVDGQLIPSVELNSVNICSDGDCENSVDLSNPASGRLLQVTDVHGVQMPVATCKEVTISSVAAEVSERTVIQPATLATVGIAPSTVGFRRTFDQLLTFIVLKGRNLLENLATSWFHR